LKVATERQTIVLAQLERFGVDVMDLTFPEYQEASDFPPPPLVPSLQEEDRLQDDAPSGSAETH
jgi:hypothetical protein